MSNYQGNVLSNSSFLHNLLASNAVQEDKVDKGHSEFNFVRKSFSGKYCEQCKREFSSYTNSITSVNVKEKLIEILIPDYSELEIDDLYEISLKANSEIQQLADYIDQISTKANNEDELNRLINKEINTSISELHSKVSEMHLTSIQKILGLRNIVKIPILIDIMPNMPAYVPYALSAAFIAADASIEIKKEHLKLQQEPLFFTIKLNKLIKKQIKKHHHTK